MSAAGDRRQIVCRSRSGRLVLWLHPLRPPLWQVTNPPASCCATADLLAAGQHTQSLIQLWPVDLRLHAVATVAVVPALKALCPPINIDSNMLKASIYGVEVNAVVCLRCEGLLAWHAVSVSKMQSTYLVHFVWKPPTLSSLSATCVASCLPLKWLSYS